MSSSTPEMWPSPDEKANARIYELISRREYSGKVLRVEYSLTETGMRLSEIIERIRDLDEEHASRQ